MVWTQGERKQAFQRARMSMLVNKVVVTGFEQYWASSSRQDLLKWLRSHLTPLEGTNKLPEVLPGERSAQHDDPLAMQSLGSFTTMEHLQGWKVRTVMLWWLRNSNS